MENVGALAPGAVSVTRLRLSEFRSYRSLSLDPDHRSVVLTGPNGAGKTNLLEALSFLAPGRGLRRTRLAEVGRRLETGFAPRFAPWAVAATVSTPRGVVEIGTGTAASGAASSTGLNESAGEIATRRQVRIDGEPVRGQASLGEWVGALWLTPEMERLFTEGPAPRRWFLDRLVFGLDPAHAGRLAAYERALRERARLLRRDAASAENASWFAALEKTMAECGIAVAAAREDMVDRLNRSCAAGLGSFPAARLAIVGVIEDWLKEIPALETEERLRAALAESRARDTEAGGASFGPHRSDFTVTDRARNAPAEQSSTGEQKALLISIVLANARLQALERGAAPLLLLDEVAAHLDDNRRRALFEEIDTLGAQAWMTGTEESLFAPLGERVQWFRIADSHLTRR